jgi:hypothetical protein
VASSLLHSEKRTPRAKIPSKAFIPGKPSFLRYSDYFSSTLCLFNLFPNSYIVGFTDPTLLLDFRDFAALIVIAPKRESAGLPTDLPDEVLRKTERRSSFSGKMSGANKKLSLEEMADESLLVHLSLHLHSFNTLYMQLTGVAVVALQRFNPKYSSPMRFPAAGDLDPSAYSSSRLTFADDSVGAGRETESMAVLDQLERPTDMGDEEAAAVEVVRKKNKGLRTPSFFSRSYVAWKKVYDRGVWTPVRNSED